jgi:molybdopterin molybdotransferase
VLSLESARERLLAFVPLQPTERVPLLEARGRFSAADLAALVDLPGFDNSAMDGYAVRSEDLKAASEAHPVALRQTGKVAAGEGFSGTLQAGECIRIFTGSPLPAGSDAVVMQEDVSAEGGSIRFIESVKPFENVRLKGEDVRRDSAILRVGDRITSTASGLLAATGHGEVSVGRRAEVALLSTGSELVEPGSELRAGTIYESNRVQIAALLQEAGCKAAILPIVEDTLEATVEALRRAFSSADFVITTGGVSVGEFDFVKEAFARLGGNIEFWKIAIRPGKPFTLGNLNGKLLFGLPGNPVSALVTFLLLVRPALLQAMGAKSIDLPTMSAELIEPVNNRGDRRHFVRARCENGKLRIAGPQSSHMIGALREANCLIDVPPNTEFATGTRVEALFWQMPES